MAGTASRPRLHARAVRSMSCRRSARPASARPRSSTANKRWCGALLGWCTTLQDAIAALSENLASDSPIAGAVEDLERDMDQVQGKQQIMHLTRYRLELEEGRQIARMRNGRRSPAVGHTELQSIADELLRSAAIFASEGDEVRLIGSRFDTTNDHQVAASQASGILACVDGVEEKLLILHSLCSTCSCGHDGRCLRILVEL